MTKQNLNPDRDRIENSINARPVTPSETAYRDGYARGQNAEFQRQEIERVRENNSAGNFFVGVFVTLFIALIAGTSFFFFFNRQNDPANLPASTPQTTEPQDNTQDTTIIERTIEKTQEIVPVPQVEKESEKTQEVVPVPQEQPAPPEAEAPKIEIDLPKAQPQENSEPESSQPPSEQPTNEQP